MRLRKGTSSNRSVASKALNQQEEVSAISKIEETEVDEEFEEMKEDIQRATQEAEMLKQQMAKTNSASSQKKKEHDAMGMASPPSKPFNPNQDLDV